MPVRVEFYGIVRRRIGVESAKVQAATLGEALTALGRGFPDFQASCLDRGAKLRSGFLASINGRRFTNDPAEALSPTDTILILSADAGG